MRIDTRTDNIFRDNMGSHVRTELENEWASENKYHA
jgi:hypothetical protein